MPSTIGIVRETKNKWERRVPLTPDDLKKLLSENSFKTIIQPSGNRIFPNDNYIKVGAIVQEELVDCDLIIGIKEVKLEDIIADKVY